MSRSLRYFDHQFAFFIVAFCLPLLFLPKINLLTFQGRETAGIRLDDIFLLILAVVIYWANFALKKSMQDIEKWMFCLIGFSMLSFLSNRFLVSAGYLHVNAVIFYAVRLLEYFIFFYIGALTTLFFNSTSIMKAFLGWNFLLMFSQKIGIVGQFSNWGYISNASERVAGIGSFPAETGLFLNMAFCYLAFDESPFSKWVCVLPKTLQFFFKRTYLYWLFLICATLIIWTGARIAIVALLLSFLFRLKDEFNFRSIGSMTATILFVTGGALLMVNLIMDNDAIVKRSAGLISVKNLELISTVWTHISTDYDPIGFEAVKYDSYDMSWWMRIHKWMYALKIYVLNPECWLQGIGPGFAMAGLDGGYLRILTENGILGSILYWKVFSAIYRKSVQLRWMMIAFLINMIFFDVYLAYKPMSLLFFMTGYIYSQQQAEENDQLLALA